MTKLKAALMALASLSLLEYSVAERGYSIAFVGQKRERSLSHNVQHDYRHPPALSTVGRQTASSSRLFLDGGRMHANGKFPNTQTSNNSDYQYGGNNGKKSSTELSFMSSGEATLPYPTTNVKVYCDMDGVLCDFERGVQQLLNRGTQDLVKGTMWKHISNADAFFENLSWTGDGKRLWNAIRKLQPDILTGVPQHKSSRIEKFKWCQRELGLDRLHHVDKAAGYNDHESVNGNVPIPDHCNVITCWSNNKHMECTHRA